MNTVEETIKLYEAALAKQDWQAVKDFFHDNCTVVFAEATYYGKNQVENAISKTFSLIKDENFVLFNIVWAIVREDFASCTFHFEWSGTINMKRFTKPGRGTIFWVKENGRWQVVTQHFGPMPK
jgi:ketosteroid isomerase-like protein